MADLQLNIRATDQASPAMRQVANAVEGVGEKAERAGRDTKRATDDMAKGFLKAQVAFEVARKGADLLWGSLKEGFKGVVEAEKADRQLSAALTQLGYDSRAVLPHLKQQADAFEELTLVQAEEIQSIQALLLRFGVAPRDIEKTTRALLDYAAATGKDATSAVMALMKGVEGGGEGLSRLGITIEGTGNKARDLNAAVQAMADKFGGAAASGAEGLAGDIGRLKLQQEKLSESVVEFVLRAGEATGITNAWVNAFNALNEAITGAKAAAYLARVKETGELATVVGLHRDATNEAAEAQRRLNEELASASPDPIAVRGLKAQLEFANAQVAELEGRLRKMGLLGGSVLPGPNGGQGGDTQDPVKAKKEADASWYLDLAEKLEEDEYKTIQKGEERKAQLQEEWAERDKETRLKVRAAISEKEIEIARGDLENERNLASARRAVIEGEGAQMAAEQAQFAAAGQQLGDAFSSALANQITNALVGGEFDLGSVLKSVLGIGVGIGISALTGGIGSAIGGGLFAGVFHDGGWVGPTPKRYHSGGLAPDEHHAILQQGERVLSRAEVDGMGGPGGVERAVRGGGASHTTIRLSVDTLDARSFQDWLGERGGAGFVRTVLSGRGEVAQLLSRNRRR